MTSIRRLIFTLFDEFLVVGCAKHEIKLSRYWSEIDSQSIRHSEISDFGNEHLQKRAICASMHGGMTLRTQRYQIALKRFEAWSDTARNAVMSVQRAIAPAAALALELVSLQNVKPGFLPIYW